MSIVTIANLKGGVGKTSLAIHTSHALAKRQCETLLIDLDFQGYSSQYVKSSGQNSDNREVAAESFSPEDERSGGDLFERLVMNCKAQIKEVRPSWSLLPVEVIKSYLPLEEASTGDPVAELLCRLIEALSLYYDNIVIDTPPTWGISQESAFEASSLVVIPIDPSEMSVRAAIKLLTKISDDYPTPALLVRTMMNRRAKKVNAFSKKKFEGQFAGEFPSKDEEDFKQPKQVTLKGLESKNSAVSPIYLSNASIYRSELAHRLTYSHQTAFEHRGLESIQAGYDLVARELEELIGMSEPSFDVDEEYQGFMEDSFADSLLQRG